MNTAQVRSYYEKRENDDCPLTKKLIKAGYQQSKYEGYMNFAKKQGVEVDYRKGEPNQWWHLIKSYCDRSKPSLSLIYRLNFSYYLKITIMSSCIRTKQTESY